MKKQSEENMKEKNLSSDLFNDQVLTEYGIMAAEYLQANNPMTFEMKLMQGELMDYLLKKEAWAIEMEIETFKKLKKEVKEPTTINILESEQHNKNLLSQAKEITQEILLNSLPTRPMNLNQDPFST
ncbi:TnpV protein [Enterococcus casseliflavus]|uniref:TnpV protein n=1 Tax=Enterococcus casseliflavus TaxID=37734 RepID=UPI0035D8EDC1